MINKGHGGEHAKISGVLDLIAAVAGEFALGPVQEISRPSSGTMNETYLVRAGDRRVVVRQHRRLDRALVEREHEIMAHARRGGIPVPAALCTRSGDYLMRYDEKWHSVFAYASGTQWESVNVVGAHSMGAMLARIHCALADFPVEPTMREQPTVPRTLDLLHRIRAAIRPDTDADRMALAYLDSQAVAIRDCVVPPPTTEKQQLVHGDYQHTNVFFDNDSVVAVIDWDKAESRAPTQEVARAMDLSLHMDPNLCRAFVTAYRKIRPLDAATLDIGAAIYDFDHRHDLWVYSTTYLRGDHRQRRFLRPPPFVPFAERWQNVRPLIVS